MTPTQSVLFLAVLSALLIVASVYALADAETREALAKYDAERHAALDARWAENDAKWDTLQRKHLTLDAACKDINGKCWVCTEPHGVLELVDAGARYELACVQCAHILKLSKMGRAA